MLFTAEDGGPVNTWWLQTDWEKARIAVGLPNVRFHDLRHTHLTHFGRQGATTAELMYRAGHSSPGMVLRYQHASAERDRTIAGNLESLAGGPDLHDVARPAEVDAA